MAVLCPACRSWFCWEFTQYGKPCNGENKTTMPDAIFNRLQKSVPKNKPIPLWLLKKIPAEDTEKIHKAKHELEIIFKSFNRNVCSACPRIKGSTDHWMKKNKGCCSTCGENSGYLLQNEYIYKKNNINYKQQLNELKKIYNFTKNNGFFDTHNHTCKLPREQRSRICLAFCCVDYLQAKAERYANIICNTRKRNKLI